MKDALGGVQSVLILGGRSEIGLAILRALSLRPGAHVWLAGRGDQVPPEVGLDGGDVTWLPWDAGNVASGTSVVAIPEADLDVVVAAVGVLGDQATAESDPAHAAEVLHTNLTGLASALLPAAQRLRAQGHGALVVLSSVAGVRVRRANFVYGASKAGLDGLALGLADSLSGSGVQVLVVRPGFVRGRMTEGMASAPFATTPEAVGAAVASALRSGRSGVVWVPPVLRYVFAVLRLLPRAVFRRLPG